MDRKTLDLLACPATRQPLQPLDRAALTRLNEAIRSGHALRFDGTVQGSPIDAGLATPDGSRVYRIDDGIPVLLAEEAIDMATAATGTP